MGNTATCEFEQEVWGPNPGCAEFMDEPEHVGVCGEVAVERVTVRSMAPEGEELITVHLCAEHRYPEDAIPYEVFVSRELIGSTPESIEQLLRDALATHNQAQDELGMPIPVDRIETFEEAALLTRDHGIVLRMPDGAEFQISVVQSR